MMPLPFNLGVLTILGMLRHSHDGELNYYYY